MSQLRFFSCTLASSGLMCPSSRENSQLTNVLTLPKTEAASGESWHFRLIGHSGSGMEILLPVSRKVII